MYEKWWEKHWTRGHVISYPDTCGRFQARVPAGIGIRNGKEMAIKKKQRTAFLPLLWVCYIIFLSCTHLLQVHQCDRQTTKRLSFLSFFELQKLLSYIKLVLRMSEEYSWLAFCFFAIRRLADTDSSFEVIIPPTEPLQCAEVLQPYEQADNRCRTNLAVPSHVVWLIKGFVFFLISIICMRDGGVSCHCASSETLCLVFIAILAALVCIFPSNMPFCRFIMLFFFFFLAGTPLRWSS